MWVKKDLIETSQSEIALEYGTSKLKSYMLCSVDYLNGKVFEVSLKKDLGLLPLDGKIIVWSPSWIFAL